LDNGRRQHDTDQRTMTAMPEGQRTIAVVGAGLMGRGIAQIAAQAGCDVALFDVKPDAAADARRARSA